MKRASLFAMTLLGAAHAACAANPEPHAIVATLYQSYLPSADAQEEPQKSAANLIRPYADTELAGAIDADNACMQRSGDECALDADILADGQDWELSKFRIEDGPAQGDRQTILACFENNGPHCVAFTFIHKADVWKIHDVAATAYAPDGKPKAKWALLATLKRR